MNNKPPHLTTVTAKIERHEEVYFLRAYYDHFSQTWRDAENDNPISFVKSWTLK